MKRTILSKNISDLELVNMHLAGDPNAFHTIYARYCDFVLSYSKRFTNTKDDLDDLSQEVWLKTMKGLQKGQFCEPFKLKGWLATIIQNHFINGYRRKKKTPTEEILSEDCIYLLDPSENIEKKLLFEEQVTILKEKISQLPEGSPEIFYHLLQDRSYKEIADLTGFPIGTCKSRIHFGKRQILRLWQ